MAKVRQKVVIIWKGNRHGRYGKVNCRIICGKRWARPKKIKKPGQKHR